MWIILNRFINNLIDSFSTKIVSRRARSWPITNVPWDRHYGNCIHEPFITTAGFIIVRLYAGMRMLFPVLWFLFGPTLARWRFTENFFVFRCYRTISSIVHFNPFGLKLKRTIEDCSIDSWHIMKINGWKRWKNWKYERDDNSFNQSIYFLSLRRKEHELYPCIKGKRGRQMRSRLTMEF